MARVRVEIDRAALERLAQGGDVRALLRSAAESGESAAQSGAPAEGGFNSSFSIREGSTGRGGYAWVRVWNSSPIANLIEFGAPKRRGPRRRGRYLSRGLDAAVRRLSGG